MQARGRRPKLPDLASNGSPMLSLNDNYNNRQVIGRKSEFCLFQRCPFCVRLNRDITSLHWFLTNCMPKHRQPALFVLSHVVCFQPIMARSVQTLCNGHEISKTENSAPGLIAAVHARASDQKQAITPTELQPGHLFRPDKRRHWFSRRSMHSHGRMKGNHGNLNHNTQIARYLFLQVKFTCGLIRATKLGK